MESEELIRTIMAEVMANLDKDAVTFAKKEPTTQQARQQSPQAAAAPSATVTKEQYPLGEHVAHRIKTPTGKSLAECTFEGVMSGQIKAEDMRISPETLEMQAQVADSVGRTTLATNFRRASELIAVPDDKLLATYDALRPYRSTKKELYDLADELEREYKCSVNAAFIREAADVYEARGRLRGD
ncbi:diol dehydratase small subunit [Aestuariimicrobium sp. p3-SID1156]|uniref:diol dehydratase small subunit n=1 Tax=Aestuariimicrobium sp. p3-SID1156 TaxID=2916038 RepID=UPI00223B3904|nr:diol dehydratase small subunit [Aestuariimicrobium sp. p3-SID1156]MCT1458341.1 diol dehydratase small subunit [Aestuariimicrobium sp. p3-SID1156]